MTVPNVTRPSLQLAEKIIERLVAEQLVSPSEAAKMQAELSEGRLGAEDWRLLVEKSAKGEAKP